MELCLLERHCRDKYDQNCEGTKVAEGCFFGIWGQKVTEGFFGGLKNVSLLDPAACYVNTQPVIFDLNSCIASGIVLLEQIYLGLTLSMSCWVERTFTFLLDAIYVIY